MTPAKKTPTARAAEEPLKLTIEARIKELIRALGHDPSQVGSVEFASRYIRVLGKDRSLRTHRIEPWNTKEEPIDGD